MDEIQEECVEYQSDFDGKTELTFLKKYIFTMESKKTPCLTNFVKSVSYDLVSKKITIEYYDANADKNDQKINYLRDYLNFLLNYRFSLKNRTIGTDEFTLKHYDGKGDSLGEIVFSKCYLVKHESNQSYDETDSLTHKLTFEYRNLELS